MRRAAWSLLAADRVAALGCAMARAQSAERRFDDLLYAPPTASTS